MTTLTEARALAERLGGTQWTGTDLADAETVILALCDVAEASGPVTRSEARKLQDALARLWELK